MGVDSILYRRNFIALCVFHISVIKVKSNAACKFHPIRIASWTRKKAMRRKRRGLKKHRRWIGSGGFCCPAPPGAAEFPSVARWVQPRYFRVMSGREALNYAAMASASLSLALVSFAQFNGLHGPGKSIAFEHTSILVRPHQTPRQTKGLPGHVVEPPGTAPGSAASIIRHDLSP